MQTDRDQQPVEEPIDSGTNRAEIDDGSAKAHETVVNDRPDEHQGKGNKNHHYGGDDRHQTPAGEEGQRLVQLDAAEAVIQLGGNDAAQDADELVLDFLEGCRHLIEGNRLNLGDDIRFQQRGYHQITDQPGQRCSAILVLRHPVSHADGKHDGHLVDQGSACLNQQRGHGALCAPAVRIDPVADPHHDRRCRQYRHRNHQGPANSL